MDRNNIPIDKILSTKEILTFYANVFKDRIVAALVDINHYAAIKTRNPNYTKVMPEFNKVMTVNELINVNRINVVNARGNLERIEAYLKKDEAGNFESEYTDEAILGILSAWQVDAEGNLVETNNKK